MPDGPTYGDLEKWNGKHQLACLEIDRLRAELAVTVECNEACHTEIEQLRAEIDDLKRIRELCLKALVKATGKNRAEVEAAPYECACAAFEENKRLQALVAEAAEILAGDGEYPETANRFRAALER